MVNVPVLLLTLRSGLLINQKFAGCAIISGRILNFINSEKNLFINTPIFISQRSLRWFIKDGILYEVDDKDIENNQMVNSYHFKEKKLSAAMEDFSIKNNIYFINGFELLNLNETLLYDYTHTNVKGSEYISDQLYPYVKNIYLNSLK